MSKIRVLLFAFGLTQLSAQGAHAQASDEFTLPEGESWLGDEPIPEPDELSPAGVRQDAEHDDENPPVRRGEGAPDGLSGRSQTRVQSARAEAPSGRRDVVSQQRIRDQGATSLSEALRYEPGVQLDNTCSICNTTSLRLGGLPGDYTLITVDGIPIYSSLGTAYGLLQLDTAAVSRIEVLRGVNSVLYGANAVAGVVDVRTRVPEGGLAEASVEAGSFGYLRATGVAGTSVDDASLLAVGSYTRHDGVDRDGDAVTEYAGYQRASLGLHATYLPGDDHELNARVGLNVERRQGGSLGAGFLETLDDPALRSLSESILTQRLEFGLRHAWRLGTSTRLVTTFGASRHEQDSDYEGERYLAEQWMMFADSRLLHEVSRRYELVAGVSYRGELLDENVAVTDIRFHQAGAFFRGSWRPRPTLELSHGFRLEGHNEYGVVAVPEAGVRWSASPRTLLYVTGGAGFRAPTTFFEQFKGVRPQGYSLVNRTDEAERSWSVSGGLDIDISEGYEVRLYGSWTRINNPVTFDTFEEQEGEGISRVEVFSATSALSVSSGALEFSFAPAAWFAGSATWSAYLYRDPGGALTSAPPTHQGTLELVSEIPEWRTRVTLNAQLNAPMNLRRVFGSDRFEPTGRDFREWVAADPQPGVAFDPNDRKRDFSPWWTVLNLRVAQPIGEHFEVYAGVDNLLDFHQSDVDSPLFFAREGDRALFDVIHIWGPLRGRFFYGGLRATL